MKRQLRIVGLSVLGLLGIAGGSLFYFAFQKPPVRSRPLPLNLVAIDSTRGQELLATSDYTADYGQLNAHFVPQARRAFCGVASSLMMINALQSAQMPLNQFNFFTDSVQKIRSSWAVTFAGMNLAQLDALLEAHQLESTVFYASETSLAEFRALVQKNLQNPQDAIAINYQREVLNQGKVGHISPIGAYHAKSDRVLILDVAAHKYPPVWVSTETLWQAMNTTDPTSNRSRGFVVVEKP